jgi:hypothetical protein
MHPWAEDPGRASTVNVNDQKEYSFQCLRYYPTDPSDGESKYSSNLIT